MRTIEKVYGVTCSLICLSGLFELISFLKRRQPIILCYHSINLTRRNHIYPDNIVSLQNFERQIVYLSSKKRVVSLSDLFKYFNGCSGFPPDLVALTFDDGYYDFFSTAYPVLKRYNMPCTVFPITRFLTTGETKWEDRLAYIINDTKANQLNIHIGDKVKLYDLCSSNGRLRCIRELNGFCVKMNEAERDSALSDIEHQLKVSSESSERIMMKWEEISHLQKDKLVSFGSHTHSHCNLNAISTETAKLEISGSGEELEHFLGSPCRFFCYPFGKRNSFNPEIKKILKSQGFLMAVTTIPGRVSKRSDLLELRRISAANDAWYRFKCSLIGFVLQRS